MIWSSGNPGSFMRSTSIERSKMNYHTVEQDTPIGQVDLEGRVADQANFHNDTPLILGEDGAKTHLAALGQPALRPVYGWSHGTRRALAVGDPTHRSPRSVASRSCRSSSNCSARV